MANTKKLGEFEQLLASSNQDIIKARAALLAAQTQGEAEDIIRVIEKERRDLEWQLADLTDISKSSKLSLEVVKEGFDRKRWFQEQIDIETKLELNAVKLRIAKRLYTKWFGPYAEGNGSED